ncbi:MAG: DUF1461 domain-containing protein [Oceanospirillaceae bacterium]|nr:DUF1461 domain-containing protein [Oceanospirillaceae bacterium]
MMTSKASSAGAQLGWFLALFSALTASLLLGWFLLSVWDYGFSFWYEFYEIQAHIDKFGPQNRYVHGLELIAPQEHIRLFSEITHAVHHHGLGLAEISFDYRDGEQAMLRAPEVVHLQDVANLIDSLRALLFVCLPVAVLIPVLMIWRGFFPSWPVQFGLVGLVIAGIAAWVALAGAKAVFYQVHIWIFPPDHDWFFYYQDSLMSTLMKAPFLFGGIATVIAVIGMVLFAVYLWCLRLAQKHRS